MNRKIRRHTRNIEPFIVPPIKERLKENRAEIPLTEEDRITYIYKIDQKGIVREVTCVSYEIFINETWITIVYYDSSHDSILHRHVRVSLKNSSDAPSTDGVKKNGSQHRFLTWSIEDIQHNYLMYKKHFLKRSQLKRI